MDVDAAAVGRETVLNSEAAHRVVQAAVEGEDRARVVPVKGRVRAGNAADRQAVANRGRPDAGTLNGQRVTIAGMVVRALQARIPRVGPRVRHKTASRSGDYEVARRGDLAAVG